MRIDRIYKVGDKWLGDVSGPMNSYPAIEVEVIDDSEIPEPAPIPPVLTAIDNTDPKLAYSGSWYSGPTTAPGFYGNTIAYSQTVGNTITLLFTGTSIEVFCEKKVGHGSGTFQVDQQTPQTINLGVAGPVGSTSVFKVEGLPNAQHVLKITVAGGGNVVFDYVQTDGTADLPPIPPPTADIIVSPGQSIKAIAESALSGKKIKILNGTYAESNIRVPSGVTVYGESRDGVIINYTGAAQSQGESALFEFKGTGGNQTLSDLTITGNFKLNGGVIVDGRNNVKILNVKVKETTFFGGWLKNTVDSEFANCDLYNCSWASTGWASGELCLFNATNVAIHHNKIKTDRNDKGYAIKALWPDGFVSGDISYNDIDMHPFGLWNNGQAPNISIELAACFYSGINIHHNTIRNVVSMAAHRATRSGRVLIEDNIFDMKSNTTCAIELVCSNITIQRNNIKGSAMFTANFQSNGKWVDQIIDNNDYVANGANPGYGGTFLIGPDGANMTITNNRLKYLPYTMVKHMGNPANSTIVDTGNTKT